MCVVKTTTAVCDLKRYFSLPSLNDLDYFTSVIPPLTEIICFVRQDFLIFLPRKEQQKLEEFLCYLVQSF
jgi:hypothetical protein